MSNFYIGLEHLACQRHIQPFVNRMPRGVFFFTRYMMGEIQYQGKRLGLPNSAQGVLKALEKKPLCCRLPSNRLFGCYTHAHDKEPFFVTGKCELCESAAPGAKIETRNGDELLHCWDHLCTKCFFFEHDLLICTGVPLPRDPWGWWDDTVSERCIK